MAANRQIRTTAKLLLKLSSENGQPTEAKVRTVLDWFEKNCPPKSVAILREYRRLVRRQIIRNHARIEFSGTLGEGTVAAISASLSQRYGRPISADKFENPALLAGLRVSIGDDIFERSIASQLEALQPVSA